MAVVKMKKLSLIGLERERAGIIDAFSVLGCVELADAWDIEFTKRTVDDGSRDSLAAKMDALDGCLDAFKFFLSERQNALRQMGKDKAQSIGAEEDLKGLEKEGALKKKPEFKLAEFIRAYEAEGRLLDGVAGRCRAVRQRINEIDAESLKIRQETGGLTPYCVMDVPFDGILDTKNTVMMLGTVENLDGKALGHVKEIISEAELSFTEFESGKYVVLAVCLKNDRDAVAAKLAELNFSKCPFNYGVTAKERLRGLKTELKKLNAERLSLLKEGAALAVHSDEIKLLYDYCNVEYQKESGNENICKTGKTFILEAWLPADKEETVKNKVLETLSVSAMEFGDPEDGDQPPVITKNKKLVAPYESITNMYSVPNYRERDPNPFVAFFYFLFFGVMMGDAGYGFIITAVSLLAIKLLKPEQGTKRLFMIFAMGGVSTVIWGILFGGWFGIDTAGTVLKPVLFSPLENPLGMMILSVALGLVHIIVGVSLNAWAKIERGDFWDALFENIIWIVFFGFAVTLALGLVFTETALPQIGLYGMLAALAVIVLTAGRKKKGVLGKIVGGITGLYGVVNYIADILSYLRLFGLGLATSVIAMVFNEIAALTFGSWFGYIIGAVILLIGHAMNIAVNLLGTYVHDMRLQYIEFFSKFYTGEGRLFKPFAGETKYIKLNRLEEKHDIR